MPSSLDSAYDEHEGESVPLQPLASLLVPRVSALVNYTEDKDAKDDSDGKTGAAGGSSYLTLATFDDGKKWVEENDVSMMITKAPRFGRRLSHLCLHFCF